MTSMMLVMLLTLVLVPVMLLMIPISGDMSRLGLSPAVIHDESSTVSRQFNVCTLGLEWDHESVWWWKSWQAIMMILC